MKYYCVIQTVSDDNVVTHILEKIEIVEADIKKLKKVVEKRLTKEAEAKLTFYDVGTADFENDIYGEDGEIDLDCVRECLEDSDYCTWNDESGDKDNAKPFRLLINDKYLVQFGVERGYCVESTWDHRIWHADCVDVQLIETF